MSERESGYGLLLRTVAASIEGSDPDAAQALLRASVDVEEFIVQSRVAEARLREVEAELERTQADLLSALVAFYDADRLECARICDEVLDPSGALLGRVRAAVSGEGR